MSRLSENVSIDDALEILTVYGTRMTAELLKGFSEPTPRGRWFRIVKIADGVSTIELTEERGLPREPTGAMLGLISGDYLEWPLMTRDQARTVYNAVRALCVPAAPFGWWDTFNECLYREEESAKRAEAAGNKVVPLYS